MGGVLARRDYKGSGEHERTMTFYFYDLCTTCYDPLMIHDS